MTDWGYEGCQIISEKSPIFSVWGVPKEAQCAVTTLLMLCVPHETPDLCRDMDSVSFRVGAALFPSYCGIGESTHSKADKRVIEAESVQCVCRPFEAFYFVYICLFFYFYHYAPWVLSLFRNWKKISTNYLNIYGNVFSTHFLKHLDLI